LPLGVSQVAVVVSHRIYVDDIQEAQATRQPRTALRRDHPGRCRLKRCVACPIRDRSRSDSPGCSLFDLQVVVVVEGPRVEHIGRGQRVADEGDHGVVEVVAR
jgi:hypothetical protein